MNKQVNTAATGIEIWDVDAIPVKDKSELDTLSSLDLVARARARDTLAFEELLGRHEEKMFRLAMRFVHNRHDAREILQEVYLSTWRKLPAYEGRGEFGSWLYRVTHNASLMFLRTRHRHPEVAMDDISPAVLSEVAQQTRHGPRQPQKPDEEIQSMELRHELQKAIDSLPVGLRTVFLVREIEGLSTEHAAKSLGLSQPVIKMRLHRARRALRENMANYRAA